MGIVRSDVAFSLEKSAGTHENGKVWWALWESQEGACSAVSLGLVSDILGYSDSRRMVGEAYLVSQFLQRP